ncbi:MAG: hypothetical protein ABH828_00125 [archaeon]
MKTWLCENCGCEQKQVKKPTECPLCRRWNATFMELERKALSKEEKESTKKYEEVIKKLEEYTEDCETEQVKYSLED